MNRLDFLKEMKMGFLKTVSALYEPVMDEDLAKINQAADQLLGVQWTFLLKEWQGIGRIDQKFVKGQPVVVMYRDDNVYAYSGICPSCSKLIHISIQEEVCKCLYCEKQASFINEKVPDNLILTEYPLKKEKDGYYIAMNNEIQDGLYA